MTQKFVTTTEWTQYSFLTGPLITDPSFVQFTFSGPIGTAFYFDDVSFAAVPETGTVVAGLLLLLPFGASALRKLRRDSTSPKTDTTCPA